MRKLMRKLTKKLEENKMKEDEKKNTVAEIIQKHIMGDGALYMDKDAAKILIKMVDRLETGFNLAETYLKEHLEFVKTLERP